MVLAKYLLIGKLQIFFDHLTTSTRLELWQMFCLVGSKNYLTEYKNWQELIAMAKSQL